MPPHLTARFIVSSACLLGIVSARAQTGTQTTAQHNLSDASLEELLDVQVSSVSKKEQKLSRVGAAVFVINAEDIRRSGATNIPDLLRMAPGMNVAQIDAHTWAISIRGLNGRYADEVLVLIDGRSVYSPMTSGVNWDQQDVPLEDIDRIEIIRGPGGTVWGANAVNGVVNITTKSAAATQGGLVSASGGSQGARGLTQYGGTLGQSGAYRVFGNYSNVANSDTAGQLPSVDGWHTLHGGFRSDWNVSPRDSLTVQGDVSQMGAGRMLATLMNNDPNEHIMRDKITAGSADVLGRWNRALANGSEMSLQVYYDEYNRLESGVREVRNTVDIDFHDHMKLGSRQDIVWGFGYRVTHDNITPGFAITFTPPRRTDNLYSTFVQDEIRLTDSVSLTLGSKFEHNGYTGFEYEPSAQLVWSPNGRQEVWGSVARAVSQPSRTDSDLETDFGTTPVPGGGFGILRVIGDPQRKAEHVYDYELGYRGQLGKRFSLDAAAYVSVHDGMESLEPKQPFFITTPVPQLILPFGYEGMAKAHRYGGEIFANWNVTNHWKIGPGYSMIRVFSDPGPGSQDIGSVTPAASTPQHQFQLRSLLGLGHNVECDTALSFVSRLRDDGMGSGIVPAYTRLDLRLAKRIGESVEVAIVGQNLLTARHAEFHDSYGVFNTLASRNVFAKLTWSF